jgi:excinuclease UvrABC nuclease subunit
MLEAAKELDFERAAMLRDQLAELNALPQIETTTKEKAPKPPKGTKARKR